MRLHRTDLRLGQVRIVEGDVRITDPIRTAWDIAALERTADAVAALDGMLSAKELSPGDVAALERWAPGQWRGQRARKAFALADGRAMSPPESWLRVALHGARVEPPVPQFDVVEDGVWLGQVDLAWPRAKLIVEYEGPYHFDGIQIARDDRRYERMVAAGWRVLRLSSADLRDLDAVVSRNRGLLQETDRTS